MSASMVSYSRCSLKENFSFLGALEEKTERWCYLTDLAEKIAAQEGR